MDYFGFALTLKISENLIVGRQENEFKVAR